MPSVIIDSKNPDGKRVSVSINDYLFGFFNLWHRGDGRKEIIEQIKNGLLKNSEDAQRFCIGVIAKPSLMREFHDKGLEFQTDLEDF